MQDGIVSMMMGADQQKQSDYAQMVQDIHIAGALWNACIFGGNGAGLFIAIGGAAAAITTNHTTTGSRDFREECQADHHGTSELDRGGCLRCSHIYVGEGVGGGLTNLARCRSNISIKSTYMLS